MRAFSQKLQTYNGADWLRITEQWNKQEIDVTIPKFIDEFAINLNNALIDVRIYVRMTFLFSFSGKKKSDLDILDGNVYRFG